jgi:hypothetical protein
MLEAQYLADIYAMELHKAEDLTHNVGWVNSV